MYIYIYIYIYIYVYIYIYIYIYIYMVLAGAHRRTNRRSRSLRVGIRAYMRRRGSSSKGRSRRALSACILGRVLVIGGSL